MKKLLYKIPLVRKFTVMLVALAFCGCGTIWGGRITDCQKHKPTDGTHRQLRPAALVFDIIALPPFNLVWTGIDFADGAIYKPCKPKEEIHIITNTGKK